MRFDLDQARAILERTPHVLRAMLAGLNETWIHADYGAGTFSPYDIVGHLIHGERTDWIPRAQIILENGESRPFEPFDRYAMFEESAGRPLGELLDAFETLRRENLRILESLRLTPDKLALRGRHPALGPVTLEMLLAAWAAHDLNHVAQTAKAMAFQYAEGVGPWRAYLSILKPPAATMEPKGVERRRRSPRL